MKEIHSNETATYYCTFTCYEWIALFEITDSYDIVYKWFDVLKKQSIDVLGYVIMPNHLHCILHYNVQEFSVNKTIGNAKRFIAYEIVSRLRKQGNIRLLDLLSNACTERDKRKGQVHKVFKPSFDAKAIFSDYFMEQKLDYIHANPVAGKWMLADEYCNYEHSSASFYEMGIVKNFKPKHFKDL